MPGLRPKALKLSPQEREELEKLVKRPSTPQQIAQRGRIILKADEGKNHALDRPEVGHQLGHVPIVATPMVGVSQQ